MSPPRTGGQGAAVSLSPKAQDRHAFCPDSFLRVEPFPLPSSSPRVSLAARLPSLCSDRRVPFLKALSTGATALLSQAEGMPRQRGFLSMRVHYYTMLWRPAPASSRQHPTDPTLISQRMLCFPRGDAPAKRLSLYAGFSHRAGNTRLRQATNAAHRTDSDFQATAMLSRRVSAWREPHFAAASSARLWSFALSRQGRRAAGELVPLGPCFPGLQVRARCSPC